MSLIPGRSKSKKQKAVRAAGKAGKKVVKAKAVQKAPKTAAAVWAGRRSGKFLKGVAIAIVGAVTLKAIRSRRSSADAGASASTPFPNASPVPDPGQPATGVVNGSAPQPDPAAPYSPPVSATTTPPHGDVLDVKAEAEGEGDDKPS